MSINRNHKLVEVAKKLCRDLRKNQTPAEKIFWEAVRNIKFLGKKFYRQHPIFFDLLGKETFYIADFYCHEEKLVIEIDGKIHDYQLEQDKLRDEVINLLGLKIIRIRNEDIMNNFDEVLINLQKEFKTHPTLS